MAPALPGAGERSSKRDRYRESSFNRHGQCVDRPAPVFGPALPSVPGLLRSDLHGLIEEILVTVC